MPEYLPFVNALMDIKKLYQVKQNVHVFIIIILLNSKHFIYITLIKIYLKAPIPSECTKYVRIESAGTNHG